MREEQGSEFLNSLEKLWKKKHLTQTLNKSAMYEPVLLLKKQLCVCDLRESKLILLNTTAKEWKEAADHECVSDRKHQAWRDLMSHGIALVTKWSFLNWTIMTDHWNLGTEHFSPSFLCLFFFFFLLVSWNLYIKKGQILSGNINSTNLKETA